MWYYSIHNSISIIAQTRADVLDLLLLSPDLFLSGCRLFELHQWAALPSSFSFLLTNQRNPQKMGVWRRGRRLKFNLNKVQICLFYFCLGFFFCGGVVFLLFPSNSHSLCEAIHPLKLSYLSTRCEGFWLSLSPRETHYS